MSTITIEKPKKTSKISKEEMEIMRKKDHKTVKGIFRCLEPAGGSITFSYKKYKGDDVLKYTLTDGDRETLPRMVADHLNQNCWWARHAHILDANGNAIVDQGKKIQRCFFEISEFQGDA